MKIKLQHRSTSVTLESYTHGYKCHIHKINKHGDIKFVRTTYWSNIESALKALPEYFLRASNLRSINGISRQLKEINQIIREALCKQMI